MADDERAHDLVIERTFDAPPEVIWTMWVVPEHFAAWYGPAGASITVVAMDVRVGGTRLLRMDVTTPNGDVQMWFTGHYLEVVEAQRLVYTDAVSDEHGNVLPPEESGMPAGHPTTTEVHVELEPVMDGTKMRLTHVGVPAGSPGGSGWAMALEKFDTHLHEHIVQ